MKGKFMQANENTTECRNCLADFIPVTPNDRFCCDRCYMEKYGLIP